MKTVVRVKDHLNNYPTNLQCILHIDQCVEQDAEGMCASIVGLPIMSQFEFHFVKTQRSRFLSKLIFSFYSLLKKRNVSRF